jgi:hypothetical protein
MTKSRFESAEELIEVALTRFFEDDLDDDFDDETIAAILRADAQCDRGEGLDFKEALIQLRRKYEQQ